MAKASYPSASAPAHLRQLLPEIPGLVIFDFDGVIADSEVISLCSLRQALENHGIHLTLEDVRARYLGVATDKIIRDVEAASPGQIADGFKQAWQEVLFARFRRELVPVPGIVDLLDRIDARGLPYCIASSGSFERIGIALEAMGLTDQFENVFSTELVRNGKPAPDLFLHAAGAMGVAPEDCIVIEDSPFGVMAASAAKMLAIGFVGGAHLSGLRELHRDALLAAGAHHVVASLDEIVFGASE